MVYVRVGFSEQELRGRIKAAGAIWRARHKVWEVNWRMVRELVLQTRVVSEMADQVPYTCRYIPADVYICLCMVAYTDGWV